MEKAEEAILILTREDISMIWLLSIGGLIYVVFTVILILEAIKRFRKPSKKKKTKGKA